MTNIQVEDVSDVRKRLTFEIPIDKVNDVIDAEYRDLKKNIQLKGFRRGKVPIDILKARFKENVEADAARRIIEETFEKGLEERNIDAVSVIKIEPESIVSDKPFTYTAEVEVPPSIEVSGYRGLELTKYVLEVSEEQIDEQIELIRDRNAHFKPREAGAEVTSDDQVTVNVKAEKDGDELAELSVYDYHLELGREFFLPDFDAEIVGMKVGETRAVSLELPEDFALSDLAGETVDFEVHLLEAKARVRPDADDDLAKDFGEFETLEEMRADIRKELQKSLDRQTESELEDQIIDALVEKHPVEVPEALVENRINRTIEEAGRRFAEIGVDPSRFGLEDLEQREYLRPNAEKTVKAGLILKAIAEKEEFHVTDEEVREVLEKRAEEAGITADHLKDYLDASGAMGDFKGRLLQEKVLDMIKEHAQITDEEAPAEESENSEESQTEDPE